MAEKEEGGGSPPFIMPHFFTVMSWSLSLPAGRFVLFPRHHDRAPRRLIGWGAGWVLWFISRSYIHGSRSRPISWMQILVRVVTRPQQSVVHAARQSIRCSGFPNCRLNDGEDPEGVGGSIDDFVSPTFCLGTGKWHHERHFLKDLSEATRQDQAHHGPENRHKQDPSISNHKAFDGRD